MGLLGSGPLNGVGGGSSFFFAPGPEPAVGKGVVVGFESLAINVLRNLQFSYMILKGFRFTTRALRDLNYSRDDGGIFGGDGTSGRSCGSCRWGSVGMVGSGGQKVGRTGTSRSRLSVGKPLGGRSGGGSGSGSGSDSGSGSGRVRNDRGLGGAGRRAKCTGGEGSVEGKGPGIGGTASNRSRSRGSTWSQGGNGALTGNVDGQGIKGTSGGKGAPTTGKAEGQGIEGSPGGNGATTGNGGQGRKGNPLEGVDGTKLGDVNTPGRPTISSSLTSAEEPSELFFREGGSAAASSGLATGEPGVPAESAHVTKSSKGFTNATLSVTGLGAVDNISNQLKPMKGFMKSVKMATGVMSGVKTATGVIQKFQAPAGGVLIGFGAANGVVLGFETARMIVKAGKISKDFASVWKSTRIQMGILSKAEINAAAAKARREKFLKGLKASDGALTLVRLTKEFSGGVGSSVQGGLTNWDLMAKSYDLSNGITKVLEAVLGLKGGGMIGLAGKGFGALKGAVCGLGMSVKLVKAVVISKEVSIFVIKGFGIGKTAIEAYKATQDGRKMMKWLIFKDTSEDSATEELLLQVANIAPVKGRIDAKTLETLKTYAQERPTRGRQGTTPSIMHFLACLLFARYEAFDTCDPDEEDRLASSSSSSSYILFLSLPI